jgi:hypothetical protein
LATLPEAEQKLHLDAILNKAEQEGAYLPYEAYKNFKDSLVLKSPTFAENNKNVSFNLNYNFADFIQKGNAIKAGMMAVQFREALNRTIEKTLEKGKNGQTKDSTMKEFINNFIKEKYLNSQSANQGAYQNVPQKVLDVFGWWLDSVAIKFMPTVATNDLILDGVQTIIDGGEFRKRIKGMAVGVNLLFKTTEEEDDRLLKFFDSLKNIDRIKHLFALEDAGRITNTYSSKFRKFVSKEQTMGYLMLKFNGYLRLMSFIGEEFGSSELKKLIIDVQRGKEITPETIAKINRATDKYLANFGPATKGTSVKHTDLALKQNLRYKTWMMPLLLRKWGRIGAKTGEYRNKPVYSMAFNRMYIAAMRSAQNSRFKAMQNIGNSLGTGTIFEDRQKVAAGNTRMQRIMNELDQFTPEELRQNTLAFALNMAIIIANSALVYIKYLEPEDEEETAWKNYKKMMQERPFDGLLMMGFIASGLGLSVTGLFKTAAVIGFVEGIAPDLFYDATEQTKWSSNAALYTHKYMPGGKLAEMVTPDEWWYNDSWIEKKENYKEAHEWSNRW